MREDKEFPFGTAVTNYGRVWRKGAGKRGLKYGKFSCVWKSAGKRGWDNACRAVGSGDFNTVFTKTLVRLICHFPGIEVNTLNPPHFSIEFKELNSIQLSNSLFI